MRFSAKAHHSAADRPIVKDTANMTDAPSMREPLDALLYTRIPEKRRGTGLTIPNKVDVDPPNLRPSDVFRPGPGPVNRRQQRFIAGAQSGRPYISALIYTDGACLSNGQWDARAGWAVSFGSLYGQVLSGRLERRGPFGDVAEQTSNRAELRAAVAGLRCFQWAHDGFGAVVVASDSVYLVEGITVWARSWIRNGWRTAEGEPVKNRDLWEVLLGEVERWHELGVLIVFFGGFRGSGTRSLIVGRRRELRDWRRDNSMILWSPRTSNGQQRKPNSLCWKGYANLILLPL